MLLRRQHENSKDELRRQDKLNNHPLRDRRPASKFRRNGQIALKQSFDDIRGDYAGDDLDDEEEEAAHD